EHEHVGWELRDALAGPPRGGGFLDLDAGALEHRAYELAQAGVVVGDERAQRLAALGGLRRDGAERPAVFVDEQAVAARRLRGVEGCIRLPCEIRGCLRVRGRDGDAARERRQLRAPMRAERSANAVADAH